MKRPYPIVWLCHIHFMGTIMHRENNPSAPSASRGAEGSQPTAGGRRTDRVGRSSERRDSHLGCCFLFNFLIPVMRGLNIRITPIVHNVMVTSGATGFPATRPDSPIHLSRSKLSLADPMSAHATVCFADENLEPRHIGRKDEKHGKSLFEITSGIRLKSPILNSQFKFIQIF
jgi:hypothetical protein